MKIFTHKDIVNLKIQPNQCYKWVLDMLKNKDKVILPAKTSMKPTEDIFYNVMPCLLPQYNVGGIKVVNRYPHRNPVLDSQILLYDYKTGSNKAILDGNFITAMRTGAVAAQSIKLLAKKEFKTIGIIGLGNQARATLKVLLSIFPKEKFLLKLMKYKNQHLLFKEYIQNLPSSDRIEFVFSDTYKDVVKKSDVIISSVTYFDKDICENDCFDEGCLVVPIHTRGFMNCDLFFDKVYADDKFHVKGFKYYNNFKKFGEISDVINGNIEGRKNDKERIIVYNIGLSMHDIYFAEKVYQLFQLKNLGEDIKLESPKEKFWL